jgi:glycosyltransferase involved in cell wall biosynthesis
MAPADPGSGPHRPRVSIGVPVYNGEAFLEEALASIRAQTFSDYELILSDNASTDGTRAICERHAARDPRIQYVRNAVNIGGDRNYYRCFELSGGEYFMTVAYDDRLDPRYVHETIRFLDAHPDVVLCHSRSHEIDGSGNVVRDLEPNPFTTSPSPHERFYDAVCVSRYVVANFGMLRSSVLRQMPPLAAYPSSDAFWQAELALRGRLYEIPEFLFYRRIHPGAGHLTPMHERLVWSNPADGDAIFFPTWRRLGEYLSSVARAPIGFAERLRCLVQVGRYVGEKRVLGQMIRDLRMAVRNRLRTSRLGPALRSRTPK